MGLSCFKSGRKEPNMVKMYTQVNFKPQEQFFDFKANDITGKRVDFYIYKNRKAIIVVNVATKCRNIQKYYGALNQFYKQFRQQKVQILAFPCGQLGQNAEEQIKQNQKIRKHILKEYGVQFPLFQRVDVSGEKTHPVYNYLKSHSQLYHPKTGKSDRITENFTIFLLNHDGKVVKFYKPSTELKQLKQTVRKLIRFAPSSQEIQY